MLASSTYFISAGNIKESVIHRERKEGRFSLLFWWRWGVLLPVYRKTTWITGVPASVVQPRQTVSSVCFSCVATSSENGSVLWVCCQVKSAVMTMYEDKIRSQGDVILETGSPAMSLCVFPPSGLNCRLSLCYFPPNLWPCVCAVLYWFVKVFQHKSFNTASTLAHLDFAWFLLADGLPTSFQLFLCIVM